MEKENVKEIVIEVELKNLIKIFIKKKWWFVGVFLVVSIAGILFTFLRTPQFSMTSSIVIASIKQEYFENLIQILPEKTNALISVNNFTEEEEFFSEDLLQGTIKNLKFDIDIDELKDAINIYTAGNGILRLTTVHADADSAFEINKVLFEKYLSKRNFEISKTYDDLLNEIDSKMSSTLKEIEDLSRSSEDISAPIDTEIKLKYETYYNLEESKKILIENKAYFIDRITVIEEPDISNIYGYFNYKRDILFSILLAIALGLISVFAINYFQSLRKQKS